MNIKDDLRIVTIGGLSGGLGYLTTLPFEFVKQHVQNGTSKNHIRNMVSKEGYKILFNGASIGLKVIIPQMAIKFYSLKYYNNITNNIIISSALAGFTDGLFLGPPLAIQAVMQTKPSLTKVEANNLIIGKNIFNYCLPMALRNSMYTMSLIGFSTVLKKNFYPEKKFTFFENFLLALGMNTIGVALCSPFDIIRANQTKNIIEGKTTNILKISKKIINTSGYKGFYLGYSTLLLNFGLRFPLTFALNLYLLDNI